MDSIVVNRLKTLMEKEKENPNSFATKVGMTSSAVYNLLEGGGTPRASTINKILAAYPSYTREWLTGIDGKVIETNDNPYRDFLVKKLTDENERLWEMIEFFKSKMPPNFLLPLTHKVRAPKGKLIYMRPAGAQVGGYAARA